MDELNELGDILRREIRSFTTVLELLILEEKALVTGDTATLAGLVNRQEDILSSIACLEKSRMDLMVRLGNRVGTPAEELTSSRLAGLADLPLREELLESGHILKTLVGEIHHRKQSNSLLINQALLLVESDLRLLYRAAGIETGEGYGGRMSGPKAGSGSSICLDRIV